MRTSLIIPNDVAALVAECAEVQHRSLAGQYRYLIETHPELAGYRAFKKHPEFAKLMGKAQIDEE